MEITALSSNWKKLQATLTKDGKSRKPDEKPLKRKRPFHDTRPSANTTHSSQKRLKGRTNMAEQEIQNADIANPGSFVVKKKSSQDLGAKNRSGGDRINSGLIADIEVGKYVAIDCEMVGVGPKPDLESALARVSIVNYNGDQIYDSYVRPQEDVTDWRTPVSGISPKSMVHARKFEEVQVDVARILNGRIIVGHAIRNDFDALLLSHPKRDIRDTARHAPYRRIAGGGSPKLKTLVSEMLGLNIQSGEHSSIEDARACMLLFRKDKDAFEREHAKKWPPPRVIPVRENGDVSNTNKPKKKKKSKRK